MNKFRTIRAVALALFAVMAFLQGSVRAAPAPPERPLWRFDGSDGTNPMGSLVADASGSLYGTVSGGARYDRGAVYELARSGSRYRFVTLHAFAAGEGANPYAGLAMDASGALYGTTNDGGDPTCHFCGTVFKLTPSGSGYTFTTIHTFRGPPRDGASPDGGITVGKDGVLYGTTQYGGTSAQCKGFGAAGCGTVFALKPAGSSYHETILYTFQGEADGALPIGTLAIGSGGALFGATAAGGALGDGCGASRCGTLFKIHPDGVRSTKTTMHVFAGVSKQDGAQPYGGLIVVPNGSVFGTTTSGGHRSSTCPTGCGTVFRVSYSGSEYVEDVLYDFAGGSADGAYPQDGVVADAHGDLFGTTPAGGTGDCAGEGCGTVYELARTESGYQEQTLYFFRGGLDGWFSGVGDGLLLDSAGDLFGATFLGGNTHSKCGSTGCGTIFEIPHSPLAR
jgi:hypothetical protein